MGIFRRRSTYQTPTAEVARPGASEIELAQLSGVAQSLWTLVYGANGPRYARAEFGSPRNVPRGQRTAVYRDRTTHAWQVEISSWRPATDYGRQAYLLRHIATYPVSSMMAPSSTLDVVVAPGNEFVTVDMLDSRIEDTPLGPPECSALQVALTGLVQQRQAASQPAIGRYSLPNAA